MRKLPLKLITLFLALTIFITYIPVFSAETGNKWLKFNKTGDTSQAIIVEGRGVKLVNSAPAGYYLSQLIIRDSSNAIVEPGRVCTINESNDTLNAVPGASGVYSVMGDFYTLNAIGDAQESYCVAGEDGEEDTYFNYVATVTSDRNNLIKQDSFVSLKVTDLAPDKSPKFEISDDSSSDASIGVFKDFNTVSSSKPTPTADGKFSYTVGFSHTATSARLTIQLITDHEITKNSRFRITFATQKSDSIILVIKTKQQLVDDVKQAMQDPNQRSPYIQLTGFDDLNFITSDFTVAKRQEVYGVTVDFEWKWTPKDETGRNAVTINVPLFSEINNVRIKRQEDDVEGVLTATISYLPSGGLEEDKVSTDCNLRLVVKGSGTSPSIQIVKQEDPLETVPIQATNVLDIYKEGSVPNFHQQPGSYNPLFVHLLLGKKGGRADYVTIDSSNKNIAEAKKEGTTIGSYTDTYAWKARLENPSGDELVEEPIGLQFVPLQVGVTTITAEYFVTTSSGSMKVNEIKFNLQVVDSSPDKDSTLSSLEVFEIDAAGDSVTHAISFNPQTKEYNLFVGNWVQSLRFRASKNSLKASTDMTVRLNGAAVGTMRSGNKSDAFAINDPSIIRYNFEVVVTAEDLTQSVYKLNVERLPPSDDASLSGLVVKDDEGVAHEYVQANSPNNHDFDPGVKTYKMSLPFNIKRITLETPTTHQKATVAISPEPQDDLDIFDPNKYIAVDTDTLLVTITVTAEDGITQNIYQLQVTRLPPESDSLLASLDIKDHTTQSIDFGFSKYTNTYDTVLVDNPVRFVTVYPVAESKFATIEVNQQKIEADKGYRIDLDVNVTMPIIVEVTAENGVDTSTYRLTVKRQLPNSDASLSDLTVSSLEITPIFSPTNQKYTAIATGSTTSVTVTPTATYSGATITVNNIPVKSGNASGSIRLSEVTTVTVVVTAEDKVTKRAYTVTITNDDLRAKSKNADLKSLKVNEGDMSPEFKSSITTYNVPVENDVDYIDIFPVPEDNRAKIAVKMGSKYIGDYDGNFSEAIKSGANKFTIEVTADDGKTKKSYSLNVNRGVNGQQGSLKPITPDQIDFKKSKTIYVDITKYAIVSSKVFSELAKYPDTTIIFQGIDYSLAFKGSDISTVVPFAETYNLAMSFTSPDEDNIRDLLGSDSGIDLVTLYFKHHGALPGKATLMVDLGAKYKSKTLYLHYYNPEMDRNEYYGKVTTNSRGTVAFKVDHFSTYILAPKILRNSVDKSGEVNIAVSDADKINPDTAFDEDMQRG